MQPKSGMLTKQKLGCRKQENQIESTKATADQPSSHGSRSHHAKRAALCSDSHRYRALRSHADSACRLSLQSSNMSAKRFKHQPARRLVGFAADSFHTWLPAMPMGNPGECEKRRTSQVSKKAVDCGMAEVHDEALQNPQCGQLRVKACFDKGRGPILISQICRHARPRGGLECVRGCPVASRAPAGSDTLQHRLLCRCHVLLVNVYPSHTCMHQFMWMP